MPPLWTCLPLLPGVHRAASSVGDHPPSDCRAKRQAPPRASVLLSWPRTTGSEGSARPTRPAASTCPGWGQLRSHLFLDVMLCHCSSTWAGGWPGAGTFTGPMQSRCSLPALWTLELQQVQPEQTPNSSVKHGQREVISPCHPGYSGLIPGWGESEGRRRDLGPRGRRRKELSRGTARILTAG